MKWVALCVSTQFPAAISPRPGQGRSSGEATANAACCFQGCSCSYRLFEEGLRCILARICVQYEFGFHCALVFFCQLSAKCCDHCWCWSDVLSTWEHLRQSPELLVSQAGWPKPFGMGEREGVLYRATETRTHRALWSQSLAGAAPVTQTGAEPEPHRHQGFCHWHYNNNKLGFYLWLRKENQTER